jgi:hypothetical protein
MLKLGALVSIKSALSAALSASTAAAALAASVAAAALEASTALAASTAAAALVSADLIFANARARHRAMEAKTDEK